MIPDNVQVGDFVSDSNPKLFVHLYEKGLTPDYVNNSGVIRQEQTSQLNKKAFANQDDRLFPCHNKQACWCSAAYFLGYNNEDSSTWDNIVKMASHHGISEDVKVISEYFADALTKSASEIPPMTKYALTINFEGKDGRGIEQYYPISDPLDIIDSSLDATRDWYDNKIPTSEFRKIATSIVRAAIPYGIPSYDLDSTVVATGDMRLPDPEIAMEKLASRYEANVPLDEYIDVLEGLGHVMDSKANALECMGEAEKVASVMCDLDTKYGVLYSKNIRNPYEVVFSGPSTDTIQKQAKENVIVYGVAVPVDAFTALPEDTIVNSFNKAASTEILKAQAMVKEAKTMENCAKATEILDKCACGKTGSELLLMVVEKHDPNWNYC